MQYFSLKLFLKTLSPKEECASQFYADNACRSIPGLGPPHKSVGNRGHERTHTSPLSCVPDGSAALSIGQDSRRFLL